MSRPWIPQGGEVGDKLSIKFEFHSCLTLDLMGGMVYIGSTLKDLDLEHSTRALAQICALAFARMVRGF